MSKPEVVAYMWEHRGRHACVDRAYAEQLMDDGEQVAPLIRLADHERLQAETERLQAARAADKARIEELEAALRNISAEVDGNIRECVRDCVNQRGNVQDIYEYCDRIDSTVGAALAQQGKEGEA